MTNKDFSEILSRKYDALSAWSSMGLEKREESPTNGYIFLKEFYKFLK